MGEAEKLDAMTTDARIVAAIKSTDYKYFGDYEMSDGQRDAVDILVVAARELMKLRTDHLAALRRAKGEGMEELEQKYRKELWLNHGHHGLYGDDGEMQCITCHQYGATDYKRDPLEKVERATFLARMARAAQIENEATK